MTRALLLPLVLACCGWQLPEEVGAPPRPMPPGMVVRIFPISDATLQGTVTAATMREEQGQRYHLLARTWVRGLFCNIEVTDDPMSEAKRAAVIEHEKRHCTGQHHVWRNGRLVWLP